MPTDCISYSETNYFSKLILDYLDKKEELSSYLDKKEELSPFYNRFPEIGNFEAQIKEKQQSFSAENRQVLVESLQKQYEGFDVSSTKSIYRSALFFIQDHFSN